MFQFKKGGKNTLEMVPYCEEGRVGDEATVGSNNWSHPKRQSVRVLPGEISYFLLVGQPCYKQRKDTITKESLRGGGETYLPRGMGGAPVGTM